MLASLYTVQFELPRTNRTELLPPVKTQRHAKLLEFFYELNTWEDQTRLKSSNPVEVISALLYGQVTNEPVPLALFVTLAAQFSEVFYRALVPFRPSVIPNRPVDYPSIYPAQHRPFYES